MAIGVEIKEPNGDIQKKVLSNRPIFVGRSSRCDVPINDEQCSSEHCELYVEGGFAIVKDMGSTNGTYLNSSLISASRFYLNDVVLIGKTEITLSSENMNIEEKTRHIKGTYVKKRPGQDIKLEIKSDNTKTKTKTPKFKRDHTSTAVKLVRKARKSRKS